VNFLFALLLFLLLLSPTQAATANDDGGLKNKRNKRKGE